MNFSDEMFEAEGYIKSEVVGNMLIGVQFKKTITTYFNTQYVMTIFKWNQLNGNKTIEASIELCNGRNQYVAFDCHGIATIKQIEVRADNMSAIMHFS